MPFVIEPVSPMTRRLLVYVLVFRLQPYRIYRTVPTLVRADVHDPRNAIFPRLAGELTADERSVSRGAFASQPIYLILEFDAKFQD